MNSSVFIKPTDGFILRYLTRPVSRPITLLLSRTAVTPNQVTIFVFLVGLVAAYWVALGRPATIFWGGILFHLTTILDCVDGELARLKHLTSPLGAKLDTLVDRVGILAFLIGVMVGWQRSASHGQDWVVAVVALAAISLATVLGYLLSYLWRKKAQGKLVQQYTNVSHYLREFSLLGLPVGKFFTLVSRREFLTLWFLIFCLINRLDLLVYSIVLGANVAWVLLLFLIWKLQRSAYESF